MHYSIFALKDLGPEIDLMMAFVSGDFLHIVICEIKRSNTFPWQTKY